MTVLPTHLSVSSVALYVRCPLAWKRRYADKAVTPSTAPMLFGKAFHAALEAEHKGEDSERALVAAWNQADADLAASGQQLSPGKAHALALLDEYKARGLGGMMGEPERKFVLRLLPNTVPVPVLGYIDLPIPERRRLREFKTTMGTTWTYEKIALEFQPHVYARAYQALYHHRADVVEYIIFGTDTVRVEQLEIRPSPDAFRVFELAATKTWQGIAAGHFVGCGAADCWACAPDRVVAANGPTVEWTA